jgi:hypothetical protein
MKPISTRIDTARFVERMLQRPSYHSADAA